ncbi:hypothetical protein HK405_001711, partial [Cladochytrium tenue]
MTPVAEICREPPLPASHKRARVADAAEPAFFDWDADEAREAAADAAAANGGAAPDLQSVRFAGSGFENFEKLFRVYRAVQTGEHQGWE